MPTQKTVKHRCCICGRLADIEYDASPYKRGVCCGVCYKQCVIPTKQREKDLQWRKEHGRK